jgi:hypothetical protein
MTDLTNLTAEAPAAVRPATVVASVTLALLSDGAFSYVVGAGAFGDAQELARHFHTSVREVPSA